MNAQIEIDLIVEDIYALRFKDMTKHLDKVIKISQIIALELKSENETKEFNMMLNDILTAYQNKDYLLFSDILVYEMKKYIN